MKQNKEMCRRFRIKQQALNRALGVLGHVAGDVQPVWPDPPILLSRM